MEDQNIITPTELKPVVTAQGFRPLILLITIVSLLLLIVSTGAYYLGSRQTENQTKDTILEQSSLLQNITETPAPTKPVMALKTGWKKITIDNLNVTFQIPNNWISGYCHNKEQIYSEIIPFMEKDYVFIYTSQSQIRSDTECGDIMPSFPVEFRIGDTSEVNSWFNHFAKIDPGSNSLPHKTTETILANGLKIKRLYLDWCEGETQGASKNPNCIPIIPCANFVNIQNPKVNNIFIYDYLIISYPCIYNYNEYDYENTNIQNVIDEMIETVEFF